MYACMRGAGEHNEVFIIGCMWEEKPRVTGLC